MKRLKVSDSSDSVELRSGLVASGLLHLVVALFAIFGLPVLMPPPPQIEDPVVVEAELGEKTVSPSKEPPAPKTSEAPPAPKSDPIPPAPPPPPPPAAKPVDPTPPPPRPVEPPPPQKPVEPPPPKQPEPEPDPVPVPVPVQKPKPPEPPKPEPKKELEDMMKNLKPDPKKEQAKALDNMMKDLRADPKKEPSKALDSMMDSALKDVANRKPAAAASSSNSTAPSSSSSSLSDAQPSLSEKDYIRAQIQKCWNVDAGARDAGKMIIKVRVLLQPDGSVTRSELVGDYSSSSFLQAAADSARRAPIACSPLKIPPSRPDFFKNFPDITLNFDPRSMVR